MAVNIIPLFFISVASFLNIFSYGYFPNILFEGFVLIQSFFIYFISLYYKLSYKLSKSINKFLVVNLFFLILSSIFQSSFYSISRSIALIFGVTSFYFLGANISKKHLFLYIKFFIFCFYLGVFLCLISEKISIYQYTGFFNNPNNLGRFFSYFFVVFFAFLLKYKKEIPQLFSFQIYFIILVSFLFLSFSQARAAILSALLPFLLYFLYKLFIKSKLFFEKKRKRDLYSLFILSLGILLVIALGIYYFEFVNTKSVFKLLQRGDYSGGRLIIWSLTLSQITPWGINISGTKNDFLEFFGGNDPHSTYLNFALNNGLIPSIVYFLSLFSLIFSQTLLKIINKKGNYLFVYFLSINTFIYWIFESANSILPFWLIFFFMAYEKRENNFLYKI